VDHPKRLQVLEGGQQLNGEPPNESVIKALVIVHLYEFVEVNAEQVEHQTEMVAPHEVVNELHHAL